MSNARLVRRLRGLSQAGVRKVPDNFINEVERAVSQSFADITPKQFSSIMTSVSMLKNHCPSTLQVLLLGSISRDFSTKMAEALSPKDFSSLLLSFGFLVKHTASKIIDHTRAGRIMVMHATKIMNDYRSDTFVPRNMVKGTALLRLPLDACLVDFFRSASSLALPFDERVYVCRAAIDYGIRPTQLLTELVRAKPDTMNPRTARSLLYCLAMAGVSPSQGQMLQRLVDAAFACDKLLTLWACHILGYDSGISTERLGEIISTSLMSDNPRDRAMAGFLSGKTSDSSFALKQSSIQTKLRGMLEQQYQTLHVEFPVEPGLVVDFASVKDRLAIEVNGPSHYLTDLVSGESVMNGPSKHKLHQIESAGWKVKSINIMDLRRTQYSKFMLS